MRPRLTRREMIAALATTALAGCAALSRPSPRVVVIGGGFGGGSCARMLRALDPAIDVTLIEPKSRYIACPLSNLVLGGWRTLREQTFDYRALQADGIRVIRAGARDVDPVLQRVTTTDGAVHRYDRLVMAPGIALDFDALPGYDAEAADRMPHAWSAGPQTALLRRQLEAMPDGGTFAIVAPPNPYRCPPGPYERASVVAHYFAQHKPRSKVLILDAKDRFSKQPLFLQAWRARYGDRIEWRGRSDGARVIRVAPSEGVLETDFERVRADVANVIPPQRAAAIAGRAGLVDASGWCPVDAATCASTRQAGVHVIGDAAIANAMPKSAFAAQAQARLTAIQIIRHFNGLPPLSTKLANTCYSFIDPRWAISIADVYAPTGSRWQPVAGAGGLSPADAPKPAQRREADAAYAWFGVATRGAFG
jgi:NADPH-dependent 2,4-dienoyl-CoA reductase/sulfur reductase-like enzyme